MSGSVKVGTTTQRQNLEESWRKEKIKVMKAKTKVKKRRIFMENDMTRAEKKIQKLLWDRVREENAKGNKVKVGYRKIHIK